MTNGAPNHEGVCVDLDFMSCFADKTSFITMCFHYSDNETGIEL